MSANDSSADLSARRYRTAFSREQLVRLEKEFIKECYVSRQRRNELAKELGLPECTIKVWFQNRRMKDKRQRIAVSWPFAAVYADPNFAASILHAAANSVTLPYGSHHGYGHPASNPMIPQMQTMSAEQFGYGFHRYNPYTIPQRNPSQMYTNGMISGNGNTSTNLYASYSPQASSTSQSPLSMSPIESETDFQQHMNSLHQTNHMTNIDDSNNNNHNNNNYKMTNNLTKKPKLFQPYKLEKGNKLI